MVNIAPIKMLMTGGWCVYGIVLPTLAEMMILEDLTGDKC
jgi:hypothetical protein